MVGVDRHCWIRRFRVVLCPGTTHLSLDPPLPEHPNVIFLHIPKTAGQSVHSFLVHLFGQGAIAPARVNEQLIQLSIPQIRKYSVFSGHMDWAMLDCVERPRFVFTILREPTDRILSFYYYLRSEAKRAYGGGAEAAAEPRQMGSTESLL